MNYLILYLMPAFIWAYMIQRRDSVAHSKTKNYLIFIVLGFIYPLLLLFRLQEYFKFRKWLKPFNAIKFILYREFIFTSNKEINEN